jgi:lipoate-protein ligase A
MVPRSTTEVRFRETAAILTAALASLGVDARVGEVEGEYCPGTYSISAGGRTKLIGIGQRLVERAAHVGGVIVVDRADLVNRALVPVYEALGYEWDPAATGAIAETVPVDVAGVMTAVREAFAAEHQITDGTIDAATLAEAARLEANPLHPR